MTDPRAVLRAGLPDAWPGTDPITDTHIPADVWPRPRQGPDWPGLTFPNVCHVTPDLSRADLAWWLGRVAADYAYAVGCQHGKAGGSVSARGLFWGAHLHWGIDAHGAGHNALRLTGLTGPVASVHPWTAGGLGTLTVMVGCQHWPLRPGHGGDGWPLVSGTACGCCRTDKVGALQVVAALASRAMPGLWLDGWPIVCARCGRIDTDHPDGVGRPPDLRRARPAILCGECQQADAARGTSPDGQLAYLMQHGDVAEYKLGRSADPQARAGQLSRLLPRGVHLVLVMTPPPGWGGADVEGHLHQWAHRHHQHIGGEWWQLDDGPEAVAAEAEALGCTVQWAARR